MCLASGSLLVLGVGLLVLRRRLGLRGGLWGLLLGLRLRLRWLLALLLGSHYPSFVGLSDWFSVGLELSKR